MKPHLLLLVLYVHLQSVDCFRPRRVNIRDSGDGDEIFAAIPVEIVSPVRSVRDVSPILLESAGTNYLGSRGKRVNAPGYDMYIVDTGDMSSMPIMARRMLRPPYSNRGKRNPFLGSRGRRSQFLGSRGRRSAFLGSRGRRGALPMLLLWDVDYRAGEGYAVPAFVLQQSPISKRGTAMLLGSRGKRVVELREQPVALVIE